MKSLIGAQKRTAPNPSRLQETCRNTFGPTQVKGLSSVPLKDVAGHSQHLILERFTSGHIQAKGLTTVQSQDVGELLPVQLIIRIM